MLSTFLGGRLYKMSALCLVSQTSLRKRFVATGMAWWGLSHIGTQVRVNKVSHGRRALLYCLY